MIDHDSENSSTFVLSCSLAISHDVSLGREVFWLPFLHFLFLVRFLLPSRVADSQGFKICFCINQMMIFQAFSVFHYNWQMWLPQPSD